MTKLLGYTFDIAPRSQIYTPSSLQDLLLPFPGKLSSRHGIGEITVPEPFQRADEAQGADEQYGDDRHCYKYDLKRFDERPRHGYLKSFVLRFHHKKDEFSFWMLQKKMTSATK
eukprot:GEMP01071274.1.p2 GENE.GEMP01071274.1~~GEMP01071274.1.p2  ORF type:complete len:114 (-),score=5.01 GEMP01071274.1:199-540(-)